MSYRELARRALGLMLAASAALAFLPPLLTRLVMGQAFHQTGGGKIANFGNTVSFFTELGIPLPEANAFLVSRLEYWGGLALVVGLATRFFAAGLASTMVVALLTADRSSFLDALAGRGEAGLTDVAPVVYLLFLLWLVVNGPGALSLDALVARWLRRGVGAPSPEGAGRGEGRALA
jgi:putative oxidoreductase